MNLLEGFCNYSHAYLPTLRTIAANINYAYTSDQAMLLGELFEDRMTKHLDELFIKHTELTWFIAPLSYADAIYCIQQPVRKLKKYCIQLQQQEIQQAIKDKITRARWKKEYSWVRCVVQVHIVYAASSPTEILIQQTTAVGGPKGCAIPLVRFEAMEHLPRLKLLKRILTREEYVGVVNDQADKDKNMMQRLSVLCHHLLRIANTEKELDMMARYMASIRVCACCESLGFLYKKCSRCKNVHYCTYSCQKQDWKNHKQSCKK